MFGIGTPELVVILVLALVLFGAQKMPEIMKSVGEGVREFRRAQREVMREFEESTRITPTSSTRSALHSTSRPATTSASAGVSTPASAVAEAGGNGSTSGQPVSSEGASSSIPAPETPETGQDKNTD